MKNKKLQSIKNNNFQKISNEELFHLKGSGNSTLATTATDTGISSDIDSIPDIIDLSPVIVVTCCSGEIMV